MEEKSGCTKLRVRFPERASFTTPSLCRLSLPLVPGAWYISEGYISLFLGTYQRLFLIASRHAFLARAKVPRNEGLSRYRWIR
ncbi:MAG: hypothetical protein WCJ93_06560 [Methanomicrobiales archaeon]